MSVVNPAAARRAQPLLGPGSSSAAGSIRVPVRRAHGHEATAAARYWTAATFATGLEAVDWLPHHTTVTGTDAYGTAYFQPYLSVPVPPCSAV